MAGVKGMRHSRKMPDAYKANISDGKIVQRLERFILNGDKMEPAAVTAALGLLKKRLPDLAATTISGDEDNPVKHVIEVRHFIVRQEDGDTPSTDGTGI